MKLTVNGKSEDLPDGLRLDELIERLGLDRRFLVVEYNGEPLPRTEVDDVVLHDGDRLELVRPVAGG